MERASLFSFIAASLLLLLNVRCTFIPAPQAPRQTTYLAHNKLIVPLADGIYHAVSSEGGVNYSDLILLVRSSTAVLPFKFVMNQTTSRFETPFVNLTTANQLELSYEGYSRIGIFRKIYLEDSVGNTKYWPDLYLPSNRFPELTGYHIERMDGSGPCKTEITVTFGSADFSSEDISMIEFSVPPYDTPTPAWDGKIEAYAYLISASIGSNKMTARGYGGNILYGFKHKNLLLPPGQLLYSILDPTLQVTVTDTQWVSASGNKDCCPSPSFIDQFDNCHPASCPPSIWTTPYPFSEFAISCQCLGTQIWNKYEQKCMFTCWWRTDISSDSHFCINCPLDVLSTGRSLPNGQCQCKPFAYWNNFTSQCEPHCYMDPYSTGDLSTNKECRCKYPFQWSAPEARCVLDCTQVALSTGQALGYFVCECQAPASWNFTTLDCQNNCNNSPYSTGEFDTVNDKCVCQPKFEWNSITSTCQVDCAQAGSLAMDYLITLNQCACVMGSFWSFDALKCFRNCTQYEYSTGMNLDENNCLCQDGYVWKPAPELRCVLDCGLRPGELTIFDDANGFCYCNEPAYFFSYQLQVCAMNCNLIPNTRQALNPSAYSCECALGFSWVLNAALIGSCALSCNGFFDAGVSGNTCLCRENAIFDSYSNSCMINCRLDSLSTKVLAGTACVCKINAYWNPVHNKCMCLPNLFQNPTTKKCEPTTSTGAVAGGVLAGVISTMVCGILAKLVYDRKAKAKEDEAQKQDDMNKMTEQTIKVEEMVQ